MNWIRIITEEPLNYQQVLVVKKGEYYIATYVVAEKCFYCRNGEKIAADSDIHWAKLLPPKLM